MKQLEDLGLTVYYLKNPNALEEMYNNLGIVASSQVTKWKRASWLNALKARVVTAVDEKIAPLSWSSLCFTRSMPVTHPSHIPMDLAHSATCLSPAPVDVNIGGSLTDPYPQISLEQLVVANPGGYHIG